MTLIFSFKIPHDNPNSHYFVHNLPKSHKFSNRPDLHAFILLDKLVASDKDMVSATNHDEIYLSVDVEKLSKIITKEQAHDLVCCGVRYDTSYDCLCLFV